MKRLIIGVIIALCLMLFVSQFTCAEIIGAARVSLIRGDVVAQTKDTGTEWAAASINMPLLPGDKLWVPEKGRLEIQFLSGAYLRADAGTSIDITRIDRDGENITQIGVAQGRTYINYRGLPGREALFQVDAPLASAVAYGPAKFEVDVYENGYTEVSVIDGEVYVDSQYGNTKVEGGDMISIGADSYAEVSPRRPKDEWLSWNLSRDNALARERASTRYLPPTLDAYSSDFDEYGSWINTPDYGYVWTPRIAVSGWAPYRTGRWCWRNGDYVWVSYEPWGWVPYHYGRWAFRVGIGWFWVPPAVNAVYWAPGFVAWISTPTYVSWVPLAPGEIYYGHGYYGPHSVNLTQVNIKTINVTNVYVNAKVARSVTVISRDTFLTGKRVKVVNAPANPFTAKVRISPGRPDIKPVKATVVPLPTKVVTQKALPPKRIIETAKTTGIAKRNVAVKKNVSAFTNKPVSPLRVQKVEKPKPVSSIRKMEKGRPSVEKGVTERPQVMPKETGKPEIPKRVIEKPAVTPKVTKERPSLPEGKVTKPEIQKRTIERPAVTPKETKERPSLPERKVTKPEIQKRTIERPVVTPKEPLRPPEQKGIKEKPFVAPPKETEGKPSLKQKETVRPTVPKGKIERPGVTPKEGGEKYREKGKAEKEKGPKKPEGEKEKPF